MTGEQATLGRFDDGEDGDGPGDRVDALRRDVNRLTELINTLAESQRDLADAVEADLAGGRDDGTGDAVGRPATGRGFE